jgi:hypothetical protein
MVEVLEAGVVEQRDLIILADQEALATCLLAEVAGAVQEDLDLLAVFQEPFLQEVVLVAQVALAL